MNIFFISDLHLGHKSAIKWRNIFDHIEEHDDHILKTWNEVVGRNDITYIVGDISFRSPKEYVWSILNQLNGKIKLIPGNHDIISYYIGNKDKVEILPGLHKKYGYWLSHAPIHPSELRGCKNIHGHTHATCIDDKRYFNVSAENISFTPISLDEVREVLGDSSPTKYNSYMEYFDNAI